MGPEVLALGNALFHSFAKISVRYATQKGDLVLGLLVSSTTGTLAIGAVSSFAVSDWNLAAGPFLLFVTAGLVGPVLGRNLSVRSVRRAGASVSVPVQASVSPLVGVLAGVTLFAETMTFGQVVALACIVSGVWLSTGGGSANLIMPAGLARPSRILVLFLPLAAGAVLTSSNVLRKSALDMGADPLMGALIGSSVALMFWGVVGVVRVRRSGERVRWSPSLGWFGLHGLMAATAGTVMNFALQRGDISLVAPIAASQPVLVMVLSAVLLRDLERLRPGTVAGALIVFAAVAYLSLA